MVMIFFQAIIFVLGLCVGSFVNMAVYRYAIKNKLKNQKSEIKTKTKNSKRSYCDGCGRQLKWFENIPVVSWVIQGGKARCCSTPLPLQYPIVEFGTGILYLLSYKLQIYNFQTISKLPNFQNLLMLGLGLVMIGIMVFATVVDLRYMILPDGATVALIILALIVGISVDKLLAGICGVAFLGGLHLITRGKGMGLGDVKLALFMGLFLGIRGLVVAFYIAFIVGAVVGVIMLALNKKKLKSPIPFGPFLLLGTFISKFLISNI
jgi:prepilin signal peptidase PulO-like enzyme (type II secretory pathway)